MKGQLWGIASVLALGLARPAGAQTQTSTGANEVLVEAPFELPQSVDPSATVYQVPKARLEDARAKGMGLAPLIDTIAGARVLDMGGPGAVQQLTLRGGAPSQVLVVVDGVPLRSPFAQGFDLGLLHPETLEAVELVRGGQGAALGDGALTGALLLKTRAAGSTPSGALSIVSGSFGTLRLSGFAQAENLSLAATFEHTDGDFGYVSRLLKLPDVAATRLNNDSQRLTISGGSGLEVGGGKLSVRVAGALRNGGAPGLESSPTQSEVARTHRQHFRANGAWTRSLQWGQGAELQLSTFAAGQDQGYRDPAQNLQEDVRFLSAGADANIDIGLFDEHLLRVALSGAGEQVRGPIPGRTRLSAALSDEWGRAEVLVFAAVRAAFVQGQGLAILPRLGTHWDLGEHLGVGLALGRSLRTPTLDELYHPQETAYVGNPMLDPELSWEVEANAGYTAKLWSLKLAGFARRMDDAILYLNRNAFVVSPENVGPARALGLEVEAQGRTLVGPVRVNVIGQASLLDSVRVETGKRLPTQPVWSFAFEGSAQYRVVRLSSAVRGIGPTYVNFRPSSGNQVPSYLRWDLGFSAQVHPDLRFGLDVLNLLDVQTLASVNRFPLPGRSVFLSLRLNAEVQ